jgi:hypothetical protein
MGTQHWQAVTLLPSDCCCLCILQGAIMLCVSHLYRQQLPSDLLLQGRVLCDHSSSCYTCGHQHNQQAW